MTALSAARAMVSDPGAPTPFVNNSQTGVPMAANAVIWAGAIVCVKTDGYATKGAATASLVTLGIANETRNNTGGADGALSVPVRRGPWWCVNSDAIDRTNIGGYCYVVDDQTVAKSSSNDTRPIAGIVRGVDATLGVLVDFGVGGIAKPLQSTDIPAQAGGVDRTVRGVVATPITTTNFTLAAADLTFVATDRVLLTAQADAKENGIWVCGADGSGSGGAGTATLSRPSDFAGTLVLSGMMIQASEGTSYKDSVWFVTSNGSITVGTDNIALQMKLNGATAPALPAAADVGKAVQVSAAGVYSHGYQVGMYRTARGVNTSNVADLANFTMAATDLTYVEGDRILLVNQTTSAQNGIYVVGANGSGSGGAGTATLTRAADMAAGAVIPNGLKCFVSEGTEGAYSAWNVVVAGAVTVGTTTPFTWECTLGNWVQMSGVTTLGTEATPTAKFVAALQLKARTTGIFRVDVDIQFANSNTADAVTAALISCTVAPGTGLASANKVAHGVKGVGAFGTLGGDGETIDTNDGASLTFNGNAWTDGAIVQKSIVIPTLTGLLTGQGSGALSFRFSGIVHNAIGTSKTPFTKGNLVGFGVKFTAAAGTLTFASVSMSAHELAAG